MAIHIKKKNRGKFTAYKKRTGKTTAECLHSKNPHVRQMANFARNARKWKHAEGGTVEDYINGMLMKYATGGTTFDSSKGIMLEKGVDPNDSMANTFKRYSGTDDIIESLGTGKGNSQWWDSASGYGSALGGLSSILGGLLKNDYSKNTLQATSTSGKVSDMYNQYNKNNSTLTQLGSSGANLAGYGLIDQIGSGIGDLISPNQVGEKSTLGAWAQGALNPETGFNDLLADINGEKKFQGRDLLAFLVPGLNAAWDNDELKKVTSRENYKTMGQKIESANAGWQGYAARGGVVPFALGGLTPYGTPIEVENGEVMRNPNDGSMTEVIGRTHAQGGIDVAAEPGTQIFGKLKVKSGKYKGMQYKDAASILRNKIAALENKLNS